MNRRGMLFTSQQQQPTQSQRIIVNQPKMRMNMLIQQQQQQNQPQIQEMKLPTMTLINLKQSKKIKKEEPKINKKKEKEKEKMELPKELFIHFDATLSIEEIEKDWYLIENTDNGYLEYSKEKLKNYISQNNDNTYFTPLGSDTQKNKMLLYKYQFSISIFNITLISVFILEENNIEGYPHLLSCFYKNENDPLHYENIIFQLFNDSLMDSFHINTVKNELWSDHSLPFNTPIIFTLQTNYGNEDDINGLFKCFYRINGVEQDIEYINHNNFMDWLDCNGLYSSMNEMVIGGNNINNGGWNGYIGEVMAFNCSLSKEQIINIENELSEKWKIPIL